MKAIRMTPENTQDMMNRILAQIQKKNFVEDNKITIRLDSLETKKHGAIKLDYTLEAWTKQKTLIDAFNSEIGWNGLVRKTGPQSYECYDIVVFPQTVTGGTVRTDQSKYEAWQDSLSDEQFNDMRMNAHSHVNMPTTPSGQDLSDQQRLVDTLGSDDFYFIFIWNKSEQYTVKFVDMAANAIYEQDEIEITIGGSTWRKDFVDAAKKMLIDTTPLVATNPVPIVTATGEAVPKTKHDRKNIYCNNQFIDEDDEWDDYYDRFGNHVHCY